MGKISSKICPDCGRKMTQQFIGLLHCKCGTSCLKGDYFERTSDMKFCLQRQKVGKKIKQVPVIRYFSDDIGEKETEKKIRQENSKFAVYTDDSEEFHHVMKILKEKSSVRSKLKNKGYKVHYIFSKDEVDKVKSGKFILNDVPLEVVSYLEQHLEQWDKYLEEIQVPKKKKRKK